MKVRDAIRMLESDGWYQVRMKGSLRKMIWHLGHWAAS